MSPEQTTSKSCLRLTFDPGAPDGPTRLHLEANRALRQVLPLLEVLAKHYGSQIGIPVLWAGDVTAEVGDEGELFEVAPVIADDLATTAAELKINSERQPPLPHSQAITHPHCVDVLRALSELHEKKGISASLDVAGSICVLPHLVPEAFTEPKPQTSATRRLRVKVIGVCTPTATANVILLANMTLLELPFTHYPLAIDDICGRVLRSSTEFVGDADLWERNRFQALPGGDLRTQMALDLPD